MSDALGSLMDFVEEEDDGVDELVIDDTLGVLEKVKRYIRSDQILHRLYLVRELPHSFEQLEYEEATGQLLPYVVELHQDPEPVIRQALVEQVPSIANYLQKFGDEGKRNVLSSLLPIVNSLTCDWNAQVRVSATESLVSLGLGMRPGELEEHILPIVFALGSNTSEEDHRVEAAQLLHHLTPSMGPELAEKFVLPLLFKLAKGTFRVRKAVARYLGNVCKTLGPELTSKEILPLYTSLAEDEIWGVRKACAESLVQLSSVVLATDRVDRLSRVFVQLAEDKSRWVRSAAFHNLGPFIATFEGHDVTSQLITYYNDMTGENRSKYGDIEIVSYCAFNFPAVVRTIGKERWPEVSEAYLKLAGNLQWKVRRPLAHSIHEMAHDLGQTITEETLVPLFHQFFSDLDEVKIGVVEHMSSFIEVLSPEARQPFLGLLGDLSTEPNWRFRRQVAAQVANFVALFDADAASSHLAPLATQLLQDDVAAVRNAAVPSVYPLLVKLAKHNAATEDQVVHDEGLFREYWDELVDVFARGETYRHRVLFVGICGEMIRAGSEFPIDTLVQLPVPLVCALARDRVANVRISVARVVRCALDREDMRENDALREALAQLLRDGDREVLYVASAGEITTGVTPLDAEDALKRSLARSPLSQSIGEKSHNENGQHVDDRRESMGDMEESISMGDVEESMGDVEASKEVEESRDSYEDDDDSLDTSSGASGSLPIEPDSTGGGGSLLSLDHPRDSSMDDDVDESIGDGGREDPEGAPSPDEISTMCDGTTVNGTSIDDDEGSPEGEEMVAEEEKEEEQFDF